MSEIQPQYDPSYVEALSGNCTVRKIQPSVHSDKKLTVSHPMQKDPGHHRNWLETE